MHRINVAAMMQSEDFRPDKPRGIFVGFVGDERDAADAFGSQLTRQRVDGEAAIEPLPACHGDGIVEEDFIGDVGGGRDGKTDRGRAGMGVGAVPHVLEDVITRRERGFANPIGSFAAHLGEAFRAAIHPQSERVAANARIGAHAFGNDGRGIMRTA